MKNGNGQPIIIYDPLNLDANGNRIPFVGNIIPTNRQDKTALALMKYFPTSNAVPNNPYTFTNNYFASGKSPFNDFHFDSRIDHYLVRIYLTDRIVVDLASYASQRRICESFSLREDFKRIRRSSQRHKNC